MTIERGQLPPDEVLADIHDSLNRITTVEEPWESEPIPYELTFHCTGREPSGRRKSEPIHYELTGLTEVDHVEC